jgi:ribonuclease E
MPDAVAPVAEAVVAEQWPAATEERQEAPPATPAVSEEKIPAVEMQSPAIAGEYVREIVPPEPVASGETTPASPVSLQLDWSSGLTQIETDAGKLQAALTKTREEQPAPRAKRVRPPQPPVSDEPLIQVETHQAENAAVARAPAAMAD